MANAAVAAGIHIGWPQVNKVGGTNEKQRTSSERAQPAIRIIKENDEQRETAVEQVSLK